METLRGLRIASGKSVAETANALQIAPTTYYCYEEGKTLISVKQIKPLAELFGVEPIEVLEAAINNQSDQ